MNDKIYDVITIGGGPSGLLCTITAVTGVPINPPRDFKALVIDKDEIGEFAKYARLRLTHSWHLEGWQVIDFLKHEAGQSGIELKSHEYVNEVRLDRELKLVKTTKGEYAAKKLAICTGFYPYGNLIKYAQFMRPVFGPIEWELPHIPQEKGYKILILGGSHTTCETALKLKRARPDLEVMVVIDEEGIGGGVIEGGTIAEKATKITPVECTAEGMAVYYGKIEVKSAKKKKIKIELHTFEQTKQTLNCHYALINYNSYIYKTGATGFLQHLAINPINGYLPVDRDGNTVIPGIVAAGNIVTPISGVLTAFATGFAAGLNLHTQLYRERYHELPVLYPWLPLDNPLEHVLTHPEKI